MTAGGKSTRRRGPRRPGAELLGRGTEDHYLDAALYDFEYKERDDDVRWYRRLARTRLDDVAGTTAPIVELGAGTGRVTIPIARDGFEILALDQMESMLDHLRAKIARAKWRDRITPVLGQMTEIPVADRSAQMVICPFNGLMHLYRWEDLLACFREVHRVLRPGGTFAFDVLLPDLDWLGWDPDERHAVTRFTHPKTKEKLVYSTNHTYDHATQVCHIRIYYDDAPPRGRKFVPPARPRKLVHLAHRQIFPEEARALVAAAGLELVTHTGDFTSARLDDSVESQSVICVRPT